MKTAKIIFLGTCLFLILWPAYRIKSYNSAFQRDGQNVSFLATERAKLTDTIKATGPIVEKTYQVGYINNLWTSAGVHLIHDPSLGMEAVVRGPANVLKHFSIGDPLDSYGFKFKRPVLLEEEVEVRINLNAHHPGILKLGFNEYGPNGRQPRFTTLGPIEAEIIGFYGCPSIDRPVEIKTRFLDQGSNCSQIQMAGEIERYSMSFGQSDRSFTNLQLQQANLDQDFPVGGRAAVNADTVSVYYNFEHHDREDAVQLLSDDAPDTLYVNSNTEVMLHYRHEDRLEGLDTALLVVRPMEEY